MWACVCGVGVVFFYFLFCCFAFLLFFIFIFVFARAVRVRSLCARCACALVVRVCVRCARAVCVRSLCVRAHLLTYVHACLLAALVRVLYDCTCGVDIVFCFFVLLFCFVFCLFYFILFYLLFLFVCVCFARTSTPACVQACLLALCPSVSFAVVWCRVVTCIVSPHRVISSRVSMPFAWRDVYCRVILCRVVLSRVVPPPPPSFTFIHTGPNLPAFTWNFINIYKFIFIYSYSCLINTPTRTVKTNTN